MFDAFRVKAANLGQKMLVKMGQAEEFKEDEEFTKKIETFKSTRLSIMDILQKGKKYIEASMEMMTQKISFVCYSISSFDSGFSFLRYSMIRWLHSLQRKRIWTHVSVNMVSTHFYSFILSSCFFLHSRAVESI